MVADPAVDLTVVFGVGSSNGAVDFLLDNDDGLTVFTSRREEVAPRME
jgi:hypothetical protein